MSTVKIHKPVALALLLLGCVLSAANAEEAAHLDGGALRAGAVALEQFSKIVSNYNPNDETEKFLSRIENYDVLVEMDATSYTFKFIPKPYKGSRQFGGGAFYKIGKDVYKVLDTKRYK